MSESEESNVKSCVINSHGRFINSTKPFAKSLSLKHDDVEWRYFMDFFRHEDDWNAFKHKLSNEVNFTIDTNLRRKTKRSYCATVTCNKIDNNRYKIEIL